MPVIMDNDTVTLNVYPDKKIVHHQFHKFIHGETFREAMIKGVEAFERYGCHKWLSDDRGNSALKQEDFDWSLQNWEKRILAAGWKYWALILPEKAVGRMSMKKVTDRYADLGVEVKIFTDPAEAMAWLEKA